MKKDPLNPRDKDRFYGSMLNVPHDSQEPAKPDSACGYKFLTH